MHFFFDGPIGDALKQVVNRLWSAGYDAYLAGGCVRDYLLNRPFKDIDIATDAKPEVLEKLFPHHIPVGKQFGIIIVVIEQFKFEIATFRTDGDYIDGRHPQTISFASAEDDAKRRDFTINALFYDLKKEKLIDYVGGEEDLKIKVIRAVGDPQKRFAEDYLRMLRALRFRVQLQFEIEPLTWQALFENIKNLNLISGERISEELFKGLLEDYQMMVEILDLSGAWDTLFGYLGSRDKSQIYFLPSLKGKIQNKGEAFAILLLMQSIQENKIDPFEVNAAVLGTSVLDSVKWSLPYLDILAKINLQLKLSREDLRVLKYLGAAHCWCKNWPQLRSGFRYEILAMPENQLLGSLLIALGVDRDLLDEDLIFSQNPPLAFLNGLDVVRLEPKLRGGVLKEIFYQQWEKKLMSRADALHWLNDHYFSKESI